MGSDYRTKLPKKERESEEKQEEVGVGMELTQSERIHLTANYTITGGLARVFS